MLNVVNLRQSTAFSWVVNSYEERLNYVKVLTYPVYVADLQLLSVEEDQHAVRKAYR